MLPFLKALEDVRDESKRLSDDVEKIPAVSYIGISAMFNPTLLDDLEELTGYKVTTFKPSQVITKLTRLIG